jgi:hypothetical protein
MGKLTKKEFKEMCSFHRYTGSGVVLNAIFFDWKSERTPTGYTVGFKYMVKGYTRECTKKQLFDLLYGWVTNGITTMPHYADYKFAETDDQRFKVPLSMR